MEAIQHGYLVDFLCGRIYLLRAMMEHAQPRYWDWQDGQGIACDPRIFFFQKKRRTKEEDRSTDLLFFEKKRRTKEEFFF